MRRTTVHVFLGLLLASTVAAQGGSGSPAAPAPPPAERLTPQEAAGRQIYQTCTSPSGEEIVAVIAGGTELPASALPCSSCHGEDGRGNPEGGVAPSNLTWAALTRPYGVTAQGGREHGPYTPSLLERAIAKGVDPAGNELHVAMPRYRMSGEDLSALSAYIRQLGRDRDPGIGPDRLRVGTLLPPAGPMEDVGNTIEALLRAWADELDEGGGFYNRKVELVPFTLPAERDQWAAAVADFLDREDVFALLAAYIAGGEEDLTALFEERQVPLVGPFTLLPQLDEPVNPEVFYVLPGLAAQGRALVDFAFERARRRASGEAGDTGGMDGSAAEAPGATVATVLHPESDAGLAEVAAAMVDEGRRLGWSRLEAQTYQAGALDPLGIASALATINSQVVFFLGEGADRQLLLQGSEHFNWRPEVYAPGSMAGREALATPPVFDGRLYFSFPTLPEDRTAEASAAYRRLADEHGIPRRHLSTQIATLAAARLFEEGVKRAGRDLSRAKLVAELEGLYKWSSGLTPALTFTPNRRVGARGAYVVSLDLEGRTFKRQGPWVEVE